MIRHVYIFPHSKIIMVVKTDSNEYVLLFIILRVRLIFNIIKCLFVLISTSYTFSLKKIKKDFITI